MPNRWLVKTEPRTYAFQDLVRDGRTTWDGITNATALIHLRAMRVGDEVLVYHTGNEKAVVGVARVAGGPRPDPGQKDPRLVVVDLEPVRALARPVPLTGLKERADLASWELLRISRLSVMPVPAAAYRAVKALSEKGRAPALGRGPRSEG
jgi:predicted RNA-binding protein with PUA-like domain